MTKAVLNEKQESGNEIKGEKIITRIKLTTDDKLEIDYKFSNEDEALTVKYCGKDNFTQKFIEQWEKTSAIVEEILPDICDIEKIHIIRLKYNENEFLKEVSLSFQVKSALSNSPINISTPFIGFVKAESDEQNPALSDNAAKIIHEVIALAKAYMNGDTRTKQLSLIVNNEDCE